MLDGSWYVKDTVCISMRSSENEPVCVTRVLFLPSIATGAHTVRVEDQKPWEAMSRAFKCRTSLLGGGLHRRVHGERHRAHLQVGAGLPRQAGAPAPLLRQLLLITNRVSMYSRTVMKNVYASSWRCFRLNVVSVFSSELYGWIHRLPVNWSWIEICLHYV